MNAVTCLTWITKGALSCVPEKAKYDPNKLKNFIQSKRSEKNKADDDDDDQIELKRKKPQSEGNSAALENEEDERIRKQYNLSDDDDDDEDDGDELAEDTDDSYGMSNLAFYTNNKQDPYMLKGTSKSDEEDEDEEETLNISLDDNAILAGKADDDFFSLEMWVYNEKSGNDSLFCHHDYILPSCPLVVEWVGGDAVGGKNLGVVGDLDGNVSLWDLELVNCLDPTLIFSGCKEKVGNSKKKKIKKSKEGNSNDSDSKQQQQQGHSDAVLSLSWNKQQSNLLASSSADATIALWDLGGPARQNCVFIGGKQQHKVQSIQWHPLEHQTLLTGSADSSVQVFDCRNYKDSVKKWMLGGEVEKVIWNVCSPFNFFGGTSNGMIHYLDIRMDVPIFQLDAHAPSSVTDLSTVFVNRNPFNDCLLSSSEDGSVKVWNFAKDNKYVNKKNFKIGAAFCLAACPDSDKPIFAVGGENEMKVVDLSRDLLSCEAFAWSPSQKLLKKKLKESNSKLGEGSSKLNKVEKKNKKLKKLKVNKTSLNDDENSDDVSKDDADDKLMLENFNEKAAEEKNLKKKEAKSKHKNKKRKNLES